ncbi:ABC transporter permease [Kaistia dalseonensis]|uniref:ABC-type nitrate/sulfonate/bicarbonate transport system permease component n=1 Tax=Kaistia dalseonensis TaxID=410840 RepID=A0ABU0H901_9HYPH|nr:ABC transporter permease [Kaistia dalseonensis]MCX5496156.1 ABC transporter permease [Kaistia dalseonensis]MDQ0438765.1 ABC-type nitrate/sulfonate/bicarbonate transport system permease component [Kaistia dalseonensis]
MAEGAALPAPASGMSRGRIRRAIGAVGVPALIVLVLVGLWEAIKDLGFLPITVPAPSEIGGAFGRSYADLFYHMGPTVLSALSGFVLATLIALMLGAIAVSYRKSEPTILKLGIVVDSIPLIALTPILMVWVGNGLPARIVIATIAALFPLLVGVVQGFKAVDRNVSDLFHILAASRWQRLVKLAFPSALPYLFSALKIAAPLSVLGALIAEWVSADRGLGIMMTYALFSFDVPLAWLTIVAVCCLATSAYGLVAIAERIVVGQPIDAIGAMKGNANG